MLTIRGFVREQFRLPNDAIHIMANAEARYGIWLSTNVKEPLMSSQARLRNTTKAVAKLLKVVDSITEMIVMIAYCLPDL